MLPASLPHVPWSETCPPAILTPLLNPLSRMHGARGSPRPNVPGTVSHLHHTSPQDIRYWLHALHLTLHQGTLCGVCSTNKPSRAGRELCAPHSGVPAAPRVQANERKGPHMVCSYTHTWTCTHMCSQYACICRGGVCTLICR